MPKNNTNWEKIKRARRFKAFKRKHPDTGKTGAEPSTGMFSPPVKTMNAHDKELVERFMAGDKTPLPMPARADDRRFTDKPELNPGAVRSLPTNHLALVENRTLFPTTVVDINEQFSGRVLVSGKNNRKLGERILKGKFKGYALYGLSLEERATCPTDCDARAYCYGNGMQMARRHHIDNLDTFAEFLEHDINVILADYEGLMVRLHVLGDFPSDDYVTLWASLLTRYPRLACYGYTHRREKKYGGDDIGDAIQQVKTTYPDRFRIRWSGKSSQPDGAVVIDYTPDDKRVREGLVCPAQTDATACCASCGLCWEGGTKKDCIVFIKHGPKSLEAAAAHAKMTAEPAPATADAPKPLTSTNSADTAENIRPVAALKIPQKRDAILSAVPDLRTVDPTTLRVEPSYQRDLSGKSMRLIRKIVTEWDWAKFKPPVCAETDSGLFIIDGQHTAIAAASHPEIKVIPVMVVAAAAVERRAAAFVAHNRDRLTMTPAQIFYGEIASGNKQAQATYEAVKRGGGEIPRLPVFKNYAKPGQVTAVNELRKIYGACGADVVERIVRIAVLARVAPVTMTVVSSLRMVLTEKPFADIAEKLDTDIALAVAGIKNIEALSQHYAAETGQSRFRAAAMLVATALRPVKEAAE